MMSLQLLLKKQIPAMKQLVFERSLVSRTGFNYLTLTLYNSVWFPRTTHLPVKPPGPPA